MAEAQAKIRITADGQQAIREMDRLKNKTREAVDQTSMLGKNWGNAAGLISKTLIGVTAVVAGLRQAASAAADLRREQGEASKKEEEAARKLAIAERRAGLKGGFTKRIQGRDPGAAGFTTEQGADIIDKAREAGIKKPEDIERALLAAGSGYFDPDEIIDKKRRRVISQEKIDKRFAEMEAAGFGAARKARQVQTAEDIGFAQTGGGEAAINAEMERMRKQSGTSAAISALQPDILNRLEAERNLALERIFSRTLKVKPAGPQVGARGEP